MSSKRWAVLCCTLAVLAVVASSAQDEPSRPGPVERRAKPVTPENPIPRRLHSVMPFYPAEARAIDGSAVITLRITIDESGSVAEVRRSMNPLVMTPPGVGATPEAVKAAGEAIVASAIAALQQWLYAAPAEGPISFNVTFNFRPGADAVVVQDSQFRAMPPPPPPPPPPGGGSGPFAPSDGVRPPPPPPPPPGAPLRVGGHVRPPERISQVPPVYPAEAQAARVQGVVILEAIIGEDGAVRDTKVLRSIPLLDQAAVDAVRQWRYEPTLLNGLPVPIIMTVTVQFTLPRPPPESNQ